MNQPTNILYLTYEDIITQPIIESQVVSLLNYLNLQDFKTTLVTLKSADKKYSANDSRINYIFLSQRPFFINIFIYMWLILKIAKDYDVIHVRSYIPMFPLLMVKPFIKKKIIFDMRGILPEEFLYRNNGFSDRLKSAIFSLSEKFFIRISSKIVVVSSPFKWHILDKYKQLDEKHIVVIPTLSEKTDSKVLGINSKEKYFPNEDVLLFVYSGSLGGWQNFEETVAMFKSIQEHIKKARIIVFTKQKKEAEKTLSQMLKRGLYSIDSLSYEELNASLKDCDFGFLLRKEHIVNQVASPIKFSDYINSETYVIGTKNIGDISSIITKYKAGSIVSGISIDKEEIKELVNKINILLKVNKIEKSNTFSKVQKLFELESVGEKYKDLYKDIKDD